MNKTSIQEIKKNNIRWINVNRITEWEIKYLENRFHFHVLHLNDCLSLSQKPKIEKYQDYIFMAMIFPIYHNKQRKIIPTEVDFFIGKDFLVTVHRNELIPLINFFNLCKIDSSQAEKYISNSPIHLVYAILKNIADYCLPILDTLNSNISNIEENIIKGYEKNMVKEILVVKRNIISFRQITQSYRLIISRLIKICEEFFSLNSLKIYLQELLETTEEIWFALENLSQCIETIETTNNSLISFRLNEIIKILTIISVIFLPLTLLSSLFAMEVPNLPFSKNPYGFSIILSIMAGVSLLMIIVFKKKKWF